MSGDLAAAFRGPDLKEPSGAKGKTRGRKRATGADWRKLHARKGGPCRLCGALPYQLHHLVGRAQLGPDEAWNLVPLCGRGNIDGCHGLVERNDRDALRRLAESLEDDEYAGLIAFAGEGIIERLFHLTDALERAWPA